MRWHVLVGGLVGVFAIGAARGEVPGGDVPRAARSDAEAKAPPGPPPGAIEGRRYKVTLLGAVVNPKRPDGSPWHVEAPNALLGLALDVGAVVLGTSYGLPPAASLGMAAALKPGAKTYGPSPMVRLTVDGDVVESYPVPNQVSPRWSYAVAVTVVDGEAPVVLDVIDATDGANLGSYRLTASALVANRSLSFEANGSVQRVDIRVEPIAPGPIRYRMRVEPTADIERLASEADQRPRPGVNEDWQGVPVLNGDVVRIRATGRVCPSRSHQNTCATPGGVTDPERRVAWRDYNRPGLKDMPHGSLIGVLAGQPIFVGDGLEFTAHRSGTLLLGVNDRDTANNVGDGFVVEVEVVRPSKVMRAPR